MQSLSHAAPACPMHCNFLLLIVASGHVHIMRYYERDPLGGTTCKANKGRVYLFCGKVLWKDPQSSNTLTTTQSPQATPGIEAQNIGPQGRLSGPCSPIRPLRTWRREGTNQREIKA